MTRRSVTLRLTVAVLLLETLMISIQAVVLYHHATDDYRREFDTGLVARAESIASLLDVTSDGQLVMETPAHPVNRRSPSSSRPDLFQVWTDSGRIIAKSDQLQAATPDPWLNQIAPPPADKEVIFNARYNGHRYRCIWLSYPISEDPPTTQPVSQKASFCNVVLATSRRRLDDHAEDLVDLLLQVSAVMMIVSALVTILTVRWAMRPIRRASRQLAKIRPGHSEAGGLGSPNPPDEVRPFLDSLNEMLDRLAQAYNQQRRFTANASHELRTPMAVIKSTVQEALCRQPSKEQYAQCLNEVLEDLDHMEHLVDQLLTLSRLDEEPDGSEQMQVESASLWDMLSEAVARHQDDAREKQVELSWPQLPDVHVAGRAELLGLLFGNLISNAVRYNVTGGRVDLRHRRHNDRAVVEITNTTESPIPAEDMERIFGRFYRVERSRNRSRGGSGLGLAIAREIALRHGGDINAENCPDGRVLFRVELPLANDSSKAPS